MAQFVRFEAVVERLIRHTSDVITLHLRAIRHLPRFIPGQFVHLTLDSFDPAGFWPDSRVFSAANAVKDRRSVTLTISRQGDYTGRIIDRLEEGDSVWCKGPYGDFIIDGSHGFSRAVLVAGGTGITPFGAFMDGAMADGFLSVDSATLYYGAQTEALLLYKPLADACARDIPGFQAKYYSESQPETANQEIYPGPLDIASITAEQPDLKQTAFFLSGPKAMIDAFQDYLLSEGLSPEQVLIDAWE